MSFKIICLVLLVISAIIPFNYSHKVFKLNALLFFDPVTNTLCDETNYWTPFDQNTTCYRFVNLVSNDNDTKATLKIMLDHNIGTSTFSDYKNVLKEKTAKWTRYNGTINIIDESTIYSIMKYSKKPTSSSSVSPPYRIGHYFMNSQYTINGKTTNQNGYWTKTESGTDSAFVIDTNGNNKVVAKTGKYGIRPVLTISKSLLKRDTSVININSLLTDSTMFRYKHETTQYDGLVYKQLQGFTVTNDKLVFVASNNGNKEKSVIYTYLTKDLQTLYKKQYTNIGHGNGITYNTKKNTLLIVGPSDYSKVFEYDGTSLNKLKEYPSSSYPKYTGIGYDYNDDLYVGYTSKKLFLASSTNMTKLFEWDMLMFETPQNLEYYNGYLFYVTSELGAPSDYQSYSFYEVGANIINVYDLKLDANKKPTKNFGRLICRLYVSKKGELEDLAFRGGNIYFGFATQKLSTTYAYTFYKLNYKTFASSVQISAKEQGSNYFT